LDDRFGGRPSIALRRGTPVIEIRRRVETDWPIEQVATYLCDFTRSADWRPHTVRCSRRDSGPLRVGSEFDNVQRVGVIRSSYRYRVTELRPGRSITLHSRTGTAEITDTLTFDVAASGGTDVTFVAKVKFRGLAKAGESIMRTLLNRIGDDVAAGMARVLAHLDASSHSIV
jgi:carbon monoxide dehydrogenase subunit G